VKGRKAWLEALRAAEHTLVFFEAPHRIQKLLEEMADIFGADRQAVICRELTKQFEQTVSGSIASLGLSVSSGEIPCKGEFVLVVGGEVKSEGQEDPLLDQLIGALKDHVAPPVLADRLSGILGGRKNQIYRKILAAKQESQS
jgi:16S rRNA (cytidine1402-2'-O)-methyltransferase